MSHSEQLGMLATVAGHAPASSVFGAQVSNARGAANVPALAFGPALLAPARESSYAMRGPLSFMHSSRQRRTSVLAWSALARAATVNRSFGTDTQVRPAAARPPFPCAGQLQR
jgi:hypothetical protein